MIGPWVQFALTKAEPPAVIVVCETTTVQEGVAVGPAGGPDVPTQPLMVRFPAGSMVIPPNVEQSCA